MSLRCPSVHVDFMHPLPFRALADLLSKEVFADIEFTGENTGIWDEIPAMKLARDFLGLRVELGGAPETGYSLEIDTFEFPWELVRDQPAEAVVVDLSGYVRWLLSRVEGVTLIDPQT